MEGALRMDTKPTYTLDFRESITPFALLEMGQVVRNMKPHESLEVIVRDPEARSDVLKIVPGCNLVAMEFDQEEGFCRIRLEKKHADQPDRPDGR
jgi:TusA-related sulfurtransferase